MKIKIALIIICVFLFGCSVQLLPQISPNIKISPSGLIAEQKSEEITVSVDTGRVEFTKYDKYTPIFLTIKNNSDKLISLDYDDFMLKDEAGNTYKPIPVKGIFGNFGYNQYSGDFRKAAFINEGNTSSLLLVKGKKGGKDGNRGRRRIIYYYPYYDYYYRYYYRPYSPYGYYNPYYGGRFYYPYDFYNNFYYNPYNYYMYNPYMPNSPSYREQIYSPLPMDVLPHREVSGFLYFPQILKKAKGEIKLLVDIKEAKRVMEFAFKIK